MHKVNVSNSEIGSNCVILQGVVYVSNLTSEKIFLQSWVGNEMLNHHKSTVIDVGPGLKGVGVFDLKIYAELMNVSILNKSEKSATYPIGEKLYLRGPSVGGFV